MQKILLRHLNILNYLNKTSRKLRFRMAFKKVDLNVTLKK